MFFQLLFFISILPYIIFASVFSGTPSPHTNTAKQAILFLANAHIAITAYFYWDEGFKKIIRENPVRYQIAPAAAVILSGLTYAIIPASYSFVWWTTYMVWQNWHFGKQTFGIYSFVSLDQRPDVSVSKLERILIYISIAAGALGAVFMVIGKDTGRWFEHALTLRQACGYATVLVIACTIGLMLFRRADFNLNKGMFFLFSVMFFGPQYLSVSQDFAFNTYSVSHSLQYLLFMTIVAFNIHGEERTHTAPQSMDPKILRAIIFFGIILIGGSIITIREDFALVTSNEYLAKFITGAMFGLVVAHFIIDAHAWKLRDKPQRDFVLDRFNFLPRSTASSPSQSLGGLSRIRPETNLSTINLLVLVSIIVALVIWSP